MSPSMRRLIDAVNTMWYERYEVDLDDMEQPAHWGCGVGVDLGNLAVAFSEVQRLTTASTTLSVGSIEYHGNSVDHWYKKAQALEAAAARVNAERDTALALVSDIESFCNGGLSIPTTTDHGEGYDAALNDVKDIIAEARSEGE